MNATQLTPLGEVHSMLMLVDNEQEKKRWVGALNELLKILRKNNIPNKDVSIINISTLL